LGAVPGIIDYDEPEPRRDRAGVASYRGLCSTAYACGDRFGETAAAAAAAATTTAATTVVSEYERFYACTAAAATTAASEYERFSACIAATTTASSIEVASDRDDNRGTDSASNVGFADGATNIGFDDGTPRLVGAGRARCLADATSVFVCAAATNDADRATVGRHVQAVWA
jgi:hypothetical protein